MEGEKMEERIILKKELLEELRDELPKDKQERLDYLEGNEISDNINEIADSNADIYNYELTKWLGKNGSYVTEAIKEFGDCNDLYQNIIKHNIYMFKKFLMKLLKK